MESPSIIVWWCGHVSCWFLPMRHVCGIEGSVFKAPTRAAEFQGITVILAVSKYQPIGSGLLTPLAGCTALGKALVSKEEALEEKTQS